MPANTNLVRPLKNQSNVRILNAIRNEASPLYQTRIPQATQGNIKDVLNSLQRYRPQWNEFLDGLINRIGAVYVHNLSWSNPMAVFKKGLELENGWTIEEIKTGLVKSRVYDPQQEYLGDDVFRTYTPEVQANYHDVNRREFYPITINEPEIRNAFLSSQGGLSQVTSQLMEAPTTSDNLDEYLLMCSLFAEYAQMGGYYRIHVDDVDTANSDEQAQAVARTLLRKIREMSETLTVRPSTKFNAAHMPVVSKRDDLVLFCTPAVKAALDVNGLAPIFHLDKADIDLRIITIMPEDFGLTGDAKGNNRVQAILTTTDFFMVVDKLLENTSQYNPVKLQTNYFLHHWEVISASRFAPALLFWTGKGTTEQVTLPTDVKAAAPNFQLRVLMYGQGTETPTNVDRGGIVQVVANVNASNAQQATFIPQGLTYQVSGNTSSYTHIDNKGILVCGLDEAADHLHVTAQATYIDPATPEVVSPISGELDVPVVGDGVLGFNAGIVNAITVTPAKPSIKAGARVKLTATAQLTGGRTADVSNMAAWSSATPANATVDLTGSVTGVAAGTSDVSATLFGVTGKTTVTVTA